MIEELNLICCLYTALIIIKRTKNLSTYKPVNLNSQPILGGGYRSRTDDPLRARQVL